jgi:hypothetical protein
MASVVTVAGALVVAVASVTAAPAQASTAAAWRIVDMAGPANGSSSIYAVAASGPDNAWAAGMTCTGPCAAATLIAERWDGHAWSAAAVPRRLTHDLTGNVVATDSATNVWVFAQNTFGTGRTYALHLAGKTWSRSVLPAGAYITAAADFSAHDAWAFGGTGAANGAAYVIRYDGHKWHRVSAPNGLEGVSAISPDDMWATDAQWKPTGGNKLKLVQTAMHWNGKSWTRLAFPAMRSPKGYELETSVVLGLSATNMWAEYTYLRESPPGCCRPGGFLHWNGSSWHRVSIPPNLGYFAGNVVSDGHGGLWMEAGRGLPAEMFDYQYGRWHRYGLPVTKKQFLSSLNLALIPGTRSVFGGSSLGPANSTTSQMQAVVLQYAP